MTVRGENQKLATTPEVVSASQAHCLAAADAQASHPNIYLQDADFTRQIDVIRHYLAGGRMDALIALDSLIAERRQAVSEIGDYSEGLAPTDLLGAVRWLIRDDAKGGDASE